MTAVDTGWINDEKPVELAAKHHQKHNFQVSQLGVCQVYFCQIDFSFSIMHFIIKLPLYFYCPLSHTHTHTTTLSFSHMHLFPPFNSSLLPSTPHTDSYWRAGCCLKSTRSHYRPLTCPTERRDRGTSLGILPQRLSEMWMVIVCVGEYSILERLKQ